MLLLLLEKERLRFLMYLYCIVIVILCCPLKEVFLYRNFQLGPRKSVRCQEVFPYKDFIRNQPVSGKSVHLKEVSVIEMSAIERLHYTAKIRFRVICRNATF